MDLCPKQYGVHAQALKFAAVTQYILKEYSDVNTDLYVETRDLN